MKKEVVALISGLICGGIGFYLGYDYGHRKGAAIAAKLAKEYVDDYKSRNDEEKKELEKQLDLLKPDTTKVDYTNSAPIDPASQVITNRGPDECEHVNAFKVTMDRMVKTEEPIYGTNKGDEILMQRAWGDMFIEGRTESFGVPEACSRPDFYNEVALGPDDYPTWVHGESKWTQEEINAKAYPPPYLCDPELISAWVMGDMSAIPEIPPGIVHSAKSYDMYLDRVDFVNPEFSEEVILTHRGAEPEDDDEEAFDVNDVWGLIGPDSGIKMAYLCQERRQRDGFTVGLINEALGLAIECYVYAAGGTDFEKGASD